MSSHDEYIKPNRPLGKVRPPGEEGDGALQVTPDVALDAAIRLEDLQWGHGLTRDQIVRQYRELPLGIYLRLPDSKRFESAEEVLHEAGLAPSRAEGDFMGAHPNLPTADSLDDGGPPDWGQQPAVYPAHANLESGSATDLEQAPAESENPDQEAAPRGE